MPNPGWYDDPEDSTQLRWWSGRQWTDRRMPRENNDRPSTASSRGLASGPPRSDRDSPGRAPVSPQDPWGNGPHASGGGTRGAGSGGGSGFGMGTSGVAPSRGATPSPGSATVGTGAAPPRTFGEAIKVCLAKYVDGKGRASRSEYWYFSLFSLIANVLTGGIAGILLIIPSITVGVRRLHDVGKSAWAFLWIFVPIVGSFLLLYYTLKPGELQPNTWG